MNETADERLKLWQRMGGSGRWGIGVAVDIEAIEARLAALESSRSVQSAPETAAAVANDPERGNEPALTGEQREAILFCVSCAQDYRDVLSNFPYQYDRATRMIRTAMKLATKEELRGTESLSKGAATEKTSQAVTTDSLPDDAGRRLVAGEPMTAAEMMHALTVARQEIARLTAERDAALREVKRLTAERDEALAEVERHRMTTDERESALLAASMLASVNDYGVRIRGYLERTKEGE